MSQRKPHDAFAGVNRPGQHREPARHSSSNDLSVFGAACILTDDSGDEETDLLNCFKGDAAATVDRFDARLLLSVLPPLLPDTDVQLPESGESQRGAAEADLDADRYRDLRQRVGSSPEASADSADADDGEPAQSEDAVCASERPPEEPAGAA